MGIILLSIGPINRKVEILKEMNRMISWKGIWNSETFFWNKVDFKITYQLFENKTNVYYNLVKYKL